jgi:hypothetical protein
VRRKRGASRGCLASYRPVHSQRGHLRPVTLRTKRCTAVHRPIRDRRDSFSLGGEGGRDDPITRGIMMLRSAACGCYVVTDTARSSTRRHVSDMYGASRDLISSRTTKLELASLALDITVGIRGLRFAVHLDSRRLRFNSSSGLQISRRRI